MCTKAYLSIESITSGCLSTGCNTFHSMGNSYQLGHEDEITVLSFSHSIAHDNRSIHAPIQIVKKIDKSSPVLAQACSDGEELKCHLTFYRPNHKGGDELFYEITLSGALIRSVSSHMPHVVDFNDSEMTETVAIAYRDINWRHVGANTAAFATWLQPFSELQERTNQ
ncbi:Hcp family type VI secretion system effector [Vibrio lentus]|nr:Hcp family type VI secretion system effector [Vibrio lentus]PMG24638.1 hypothetical protein BCU96_04010 [Vibrio lentus]PMH08832.1 hypothetical protein BCU76_05650 [Vibrio lentus]PMJ14645.1 hypothetical protein BCU30_02100 [Vibrio lentus]PMK92682.1 hypothetical protein BCT89_19515 [Vibrio lentus]PML43800.1 hypothetical protein BCT75_08055 [Vibrio lentus]